MNQAKHIVIVGGGPGGVCAGMLLASRGFKVSVFEKKHEVGGRNAPLRLGDFTFDTGPTFLMMKFLLEEMFRDAGRDVHDYLEFVRLDPMYKLRFDDRDVLVTDRHDAMQTELQRAFGEGDTGLAQFLETEAKRFEMLYPCIQRDYTNLSRFFSWDLIRALPYLSFPLSVFTNLGKYFGPEKLRLTFSFQAKYLGMSPWECPAFFTMLPYIEHAYGIYHVQGGLNRIPAAMARVIQEFGGNVYTDCPVAGLMSEGRKVTGVRLADGREISADAVVVNADFAYAMTHLVAPGVLKKYAPPKLAKRDYSCSTFMIYLGLGRCYPLNHHTIFFARDYRKNVAQVFSEKTLSDDFSVYIQNPSVTDANLAPAGKSAMYILVPVPNTSGGIDWATESSAFKEKILDTVIERTGFTDLRSQIQAERVISPLDWEHGENVYYGATFNLSHKLSQLLYWRPHNQFEELDNCYLVGGGTHPGSGLPTIYMSAQISSKLICKKFRVPFDSGPGQTRSN